MKSMWALIQSQRSIIQSFIFRTSDSKTDNSNNLISLKIVGFAVIFSIYGYTSPSLKKGLTADAKEYYALFNAAQEQIIFFRDTLEALRLYDQATEVYTQKVKYGFCESIRAQIYYNALLKNDAELFESLLLSIKQNLELYDPEFMVPNKWNNNAQYQSFRSSEFWDLYVSTCDSLYNVSLKSLDHSYLEEIESIVSMDRYNRDVVFPRIQHYLEKGDTGTSKAFEETFIKGDQYVMKKLLELVSIKGFLDYDKVGGQVHRLNLVLTHNLNFCHDSLSELYASKLDSILLEKVLLGYYPNTMYASLIDRAYSFYCDDGQMYGSMMVPSGSRSICKQEINDVSCLDERREKIGLPPYYFKIKNLNMESPEGYKKPKKYKNL